jgi:hypothetical protein
VHAYGLLLIVIWFLVLAWWSSDIAGHFSLTFDYSFYAQAWWLIAHGHLNPFSTVGYEPYWHNAFESVVWPLAPLWYLWPHPVTLLWAQDAATAGCFAVISFWMCELVAVGLARGRLKTWSIALPACGVLLLLASPWPVWIDSFDFHPESLDLLLAVLAAHAFWKGKYRRGWVWTTLALLSGSLGATYVAGFGISAILAGRQWRRVGVVLFVVGLAWLVFLSHIGADHASAVYEDLTHGTRINKFSAGGLLHAIVEHPNRPIRAVWSVRKDIFADIASGGILGFFSPWAFGVSLLVLLEGSLTGQALFIQPFVQNSLPAILLVPLGTIMICIALAASRHRWRQILSASVALLALLYVLGWSHAWLHRVKPTYLSVPAAGAHTLQRALNHIPTNDEVIVSQGVAGPFAFRKWLYILFSTSRETYPVHGRTIWFVIAPDVGIETEADTGAEAQILQLINHFQARLVIASHDVFVFKWLAHPHQSEITFSRNPSVPAWILYGAYDFHKPPGSPSTWHVSTSQRGLFVFGDRWTLTSGEYTARVRYSSIRPVEAQVWDDSTSVELTQMLLPPTAGKVVTSSFQGSFVSSLSQPQVGGTGLFQVQSAPPPAGDSIELRILNPGKTKVSVYSLGLSRGGVTP